MAPPKSSSPRKGRRVESPSAAGESPNNVTAGGMLPSLVLDPSFPSPAAVSSERAPAAEASERAPAEASDDIVGVDDQEDTQQSTPI